MFTWVTVVDNQQIIIFKTS